jgi:hypothetical protein
MLQDRSQTCFTQCVSEVLCSIHTDELIFFITIPKYLALQETYSINHDSFTPLHSGSSKSVYEQLASRSAGGPILIKHLLSHKEKRRIIYTGLLLCPLIKS